MLFQINRRVLIREGKVRDDLRGNEATFKAKCLTGHYRDWIFYTKDSGKNILSREACVVHSSILIN